MAILTRRRVLGAVLALAVSIAAFAQSPPASSVLERRIKAALLSQFAELVAWPDAVVAPDRPLVVAVVGAEQLAEELRQLASARGAAGRPIRVRDIREGESLDGVQILFVASAAGTHVPEVLREARGKPVLVVTETAGALEQGSVINFATVEGKVRFELSTAGAEQRGLKLSPRLVAVALKR